MIQTNFIFEGQNIAIQCNKNEVMKEIFKKFEVKFNIENKSVYYLYNGNEINKEIKLEQIIGNTNNINIIVNSIKDIKSNYLINNKYIKCPECKENIRIKIKDYKIQLYDCKNKHNIDNILLKEYENIQSIDISKIICNICNNNNKNKIYNNDLYICNTCKLNICPLCKLKHDKTHNIINYEQKEYICEIHNENYIKYCYTCNKNICMLCFNQHNEHDTISYEKIIPDIDNIKNSLIKLKNSIDIFKSDIKIMINKLNEVMKNIDLYYNINNNIYKNYDKKNINYEIL